jgi:hypothetical protein
MDATRDGQLHHTFMQIVGFNEFETNKDKILTSIDKYSNVLDRINLPRYTIKFHRLCPLKSGIAMLGIPSIDINVYRETFRKLVSMEDLPFAEPYKNDIVHSSIIRYFNELQQENIVDEIGHINITAKCTFLTLGFGTWKLLSNECMNYYTKILK